MTPTAPLSNGITTIRARVVGIEFHRLATARADLGRPGAPAPTLTLNLFDDVTLVAVIEQSARSTAGHPTCCDQSVRAGPGRTAFIPWRAVLSLAGEPVPADAEPQSTWGRRYRRRVDALSATGYRVPPGGGVAPAGDTVEIVRVASGGKNRGAAGLWIRASARLCAAYQDHVETRLPAARVFAQAVHLTP